MNQLRENQDTLHFPLTISSCKVVAEVLVSAWKQ